MNDRKRMNNVKKKSPRYDTIWYCDWEECGYTCNARPRWFLFWTKLKWWLRVSIECWSWTDKPAKPARFNRADEFLLLLYIHIFIYICVRICDSISLYSLFQCSPSPNSMRLLLLLLLLLFQYIFFSSVRLLYSFAWKSVCRHWCVHLLLSFPISFVVPLFSCDRRCSHHHRRRLEYCAVHCYSRHSTAHHRHYTLAVSLYIHAISHWFFMKWTSHTKWSYKGIWCVMFVASSRCDVSTSLKYIAFRGFFPSKWALNIVGDERFSLSGIVIENNRISRFQFEGLLLTTNI